MGNYILRDIGFKLAERNNHSYYFYPNTLYRLVGIMLLPLSYFVGFIYFFLKDFQINNGLILYFILCTSISLFLILLSFNSVIILNDDTIVTVHSLLKKDRQIQTEDISNIYRYTITQIGDMQTGRTTRFYLYLENDEKIRLTSKIVDILF